MGLPSETFKQPAIRSLVQEAIAESFSRVKFDAVQWAMELRAIAQAAVIEGDYSHALDAYRMLGRHLNVSVDAIVKGDNHVHLHGPMDNYTQREATDDELQARMVQIRQEQAILTDAEVVEDTPGEVFFES